LRIKYKLNAWIYYIIWYCIQKTVTYSFSFFIMSVATTRVLSQSEGLMSVDDILVICSSKSQVTAPKLVTISMFSKNLPWDERGLFVWDEPNNINAKSSLLSVNN